MRLQNDWAEPRHLLSLVPVHPEAESVATGPLLTADADEPVLDAAALEARPYHAILPQVSKRLHKKTLLILLLVVVLHLLGAWLLTRHSEHRVTPVAGGRPYQAALVSAQSLQPQVNSGHAQQAAQAIAAAQRSAERPRVQRTTNKRVSHPVKKTRRQSVSERSRSGGSRASARAGRTGHASAPHRPSAQQLMNEVVSQASSNGWAQAADRFASGPSSNAQRNAIDRYIIYFTRAVQTYIDMNLNGSASGDAQMVLGIRIGRNGQLREVSVVQSTGRRDLDRLAIKTIHAAGPFRPFDAEMGRIPELDFDRTWVFGQGSGFRFR